jgi:hypothetical protein
MLKCAVPYAGIIGGVRLERGRVGITYEVIIRVSTTFGQVLDVIKCKEGRLE